MPDQVLVLGGPKDGDIIAVQHSDIVQFAKLEGSPVSRFADEGSLDTTLTVPTYTFNIQRIGLFGRAINVALDRYAYDYDERLARGLLNGSAYHLWRSARG